MKIRLLAAGAEPEELNIVIRGRIGAVFGAYSDSACLIEEYPDFRHMLNPLAGALKTSFLTVVFCGRKAYEETKRSLIRGLHLPCSISLDVLEKLPEDMTSVEKELHSLVPDGAAVFPASDGRYSAFCCRSGKQYLLFCPIRHGFVHTLEYDIARWLSGVLAMPSDDAEPYIKLFRLAAKELFDRNLTVAAADTATADFIRRPASFGGKAARSFKFSGVPVSPCDCEPQDHTAQAASEAAMNCNTVLGVAMSNIFVLKKHGEQQYVVYIAVAREENVTVSRVYAGELPVADFLKKAAGELFSLLLCVVQEEFAESESDDFDVF